MTSLYYEDLGVGDSFTSGEATLTAEEIIRFGAEFDPQPQHLGEAEARSSGFGTLVASGWHTGALSMRLQLEALFHRFPGGGMGAGVERMTWRRPVLPGDRLHVRIDVLATRPSRSRPDRGLLELRTTTVNGAGETVMEMTATVLVPRRPAAGA